MYTDFFGLKRNPFALTLDPSFLFSSENSKDALASLSYAVSQRKGFAVMTGEVGTGKSLMLRCLFKLWESQRIPFAYLIGPRLSPVEFLRYVIFDLGIKVAEPTEENLQFALCKFLLAQLDRGLTTVLVIDEAQQVSLSLLEEIRLLSNLETDQEKLLQILLVGQPELDKMLDTVELRSLKQRIAVRCHLEPLTEEETYHYITGRLEVADADLKLGAMFPEEVIKTIYQYSLGIPRLVNNICEQALIGAYARQVRMVSVEIVDEAASYLHLRRTGGLEQAEILSSRSKQPEESVPDISWQPAPNEPSMKPRNCYVGSGDVNRLSSLPALATLPSEPGTPVRVIQSDSRVNANSSAPTIRITDLSTVEAGSDRLATATSEKKRRTDVSATLLEPSSRTSSTSTLTSVSIENKLSTPRNGEQNDSPVKSRESFGFGLEYHKATRNPSPIALIALIFVVGGCGMFWLRSWTVEKSVEKSGVTQSTRGPNQLAEVELDNPLAATIAKDFQGSELSEVKLDPPSTPSEKVSPNITSTLARPSAIGHEEATGINTTPTVRLRRDAFTEPSLSSSDVPESSPSRFASQGLGGPISAVPLLSATISRQAQADVTSTFQPPVLLNRVNPAYAAIAGTVQVKATIGIDGVPRQLTSVRGDVRLLQTAIDAIKRWRYRPALLNGKPLESRTVIEIKIESLP